MVAAVAAPLLAVAGAGVVDSAPSGNAEVVDGAPAGAPSPAGTAGVGVPGPASRPPALAPGLPRVAEAERPAPLGVPSPRYAAAPAPVELRIPAAGVAAPLERLALTGDGMLAAPADFAKPGWFAAGPRPGAPGPAVIAGHVDSRSGPAVFHRLGDVVPGATVDVVRADRSTVRYRVTEVVEAPKDAFPTQAVYGPTPGSTLRLITCTGTFDRATRHYLSNLIVFAVAV
jgi:hypothetical protein